MSAHAISDQPMKGRFRSLEVFGKTIEVGDDEEFLDGTLKAGRLLLRPKKRWPAITRSTFEDCDVNLTKWTKSGRISLLAARFVRCTFRGTLQGLLLGHDDERGELDSFGKVEDCDFSNAVVHDCLFMNTDAKRLRMPGFPHAVVLDPSRRRAEAEAQSWPGELGAYMRICTDLPDSVSLRVFHLPNACKLAKCSIEEAAASLRSFGGVFCGEDEG